MDVPPAGESFKRVARGAACPRRTAEFEEVRLLLLAPEPLYGHALCLLLRSSGLQSFYVERLSRARRMLGGMRTEVLLWVGDYLDARALDQARAIRQSADVGLCLVASGADPSALRALVSENARGFAFLPRDNGPEVDELLDALGRVAKGQTALEPSLLESLAASPTGQGEGLAWLTRGEREVLELMSLGLRNREIARRLWKSEKTIEKRNGQIFSKLGLDPETNPHLDRRVAAARIFMSEGVRQATDDEQFVTQG